jgi:hypothetical protein
MRMQSVPRAQVRPSRGRVRAMPSSSSAGTSQQGSEECIIPAAAQDGRDRDDERSEWTRALALAPACPASANALYSYPWLIERISQTFFREWIGAHCVPTKIDHAEWLCTMCGDYTATWETRSGSYCRYCWSLGRTVSIKPAPTYMLELIPLDGM